MSASSLGQLSQRGKKMVGGPHRNQNREIFGLALSREIRRPLCCPGGCTPPGPLLQRARGASRGGARCPSSSRNQRPRTRSLPGLSTRSRQLYACTRKQKGRTRLKGATSLTVLVSEPA